jgi:DNA (cytosine-5-)-methyltransferase
MQNPHSALADKTDSLSFVSLYSGAGGLDLGFAKAGFYPVFANDIDPFAVATHNNLSQVRDMEWRDAASKFEECKAIAGDIRNLGNKVYPGMADIVIGGPPCQGFSVAGRMDPNDPRSKHVFDFLGLVARVRPRAFVMENVAALARNSRWSDVINALKKNASLNYKIQLVVLNSSHWGVPQARERMFLIGTAFDSPDVDLSEPTTVDTPISARSVLSKLPDLGSEGNNGVCLAKITLAKKPVLRRSPYAGMLFNGQGRVINLDGPAPTLPASMGGNRTPIIDQDNLDDPSHQSWILDYHKRLFVDGGEPFENLPEDVNLRRISVQEAAALQTFPRDIKWHGSQSVQYRQIGNAVPPKLGYAVAKALKKVLV